LFDVLDTPQGNDPSVRPNQIFAVALEPALLLPWQEKAVVDTCASRLLISYGLRSLAPGAPGYRPTYHGDRPQRDRAYHQGTAWGWLLGPFVTAHLRVYHNPKAAHALLAPMFDHLRDAGLGSLSEIFDAQPPHTPRGCPAQAWTVGETLRAWREYQEERPSPPSSSFNVDVGNHPVS
jgi:glycogen debranching enzyme